MNSLAVVFTVMFDDSDNDISYLDSQFIQEVNLLLPK